MSTSDVTREGLQGVHPAREAVTGAKGRGTRPHRRRGGGRGGRGGEESMVPRAEFRSYYGKAVLKQPVWKWMVPSYFFTGGLAAGSSLLALGASLTGNEALRRPCRISAAGAVGASTVLLVADLGKPTRFHHMLRVVKVTSPMSIGSWILVAYSPGAFGAAGSELLGVVPRLGVVAEAWAALVAPALATYTAVLVSDTAVPVWHDEGKHLPFVFAGSAAAAAGGLASMLVEPAFARPARQLAVLGAGLELGASRLSRHHIGEIGEVYEQGLAGTLEKAATSLSAGGAALLGLLGRRRAAAVVGGAMLFAGSLAKRFAVYEAGKQSAADPKYTVKPQRERLQQGQPAGEAGPRIASHFG